MSKTLTLGQRIKKYRLRCNMSQLELEIAIGSSPGTISRIECDLINPTKETISKISKVLGLKGIFLASLIGSGLRDEYLNLAKFLLNMAKTNTLKDLGEIIVNDIVYELDFTGAVAFIIENDHMLSSFAFTENKYTNFVNKTIGKDLTELKIDILKNKKNFVVKSISKKKIVTTKELYKCTTGAITKTLADAIQIFIKLNSIIIYPLIHNDKVLGAVLFTTEFENNFDEENELIKLVLQIISHKLKELLEY